MKFKAEGIIPAALMPWKPDLSMDLAGLRSHMIELASVRGVTAVCINGHASEMMSCSEDEQIEILSATLDAIGTRLPVLSGVFSESSVLAARQARRMQDAGANALLVVPRLTNEQNELLDLLDVLLPDPRFCYSMQLDRGDLQRRETGTRLSGSPGTALEAQYRK